MDCLTAQGLISEALDRVVLDADRLTEAKEHVQGCPTCSVFVRTLLLVRSTPIPVPPRDLADRVMQAVRAEDAAEKHRAAEAVAVMRAAAADADVVDGSPAQSEVDDSGPVSAPHESDRTSRLDTLRTWKQNRPHPELLVWASAAVVFVAVLGITASAGVRMITTSPDTRTLAGGVADTSAKSSDMLAAPQAADSAVGAQATQAAGSYVTAQGFAFLLSGPSSVATSGLETTASVTSGLGSEPARTLQAYVSADPDRLYVYDDANKQLLVFNRVVRTYTGTRYQLLSGPLSNFGQWPVLPQNITAPTADNGSPTFVPLAPDATGTSVYTLAGGDSRSGIAIPPGSSPSDPAAGNPNWTWWVPGP